MSGILDRMLQKQKFTPTTVDEFLALQLAKKLNDEAAINSYVNYVAHHGTDHVLRLCHAAMKEPDPARIFHSSLTKHDP
jgi:hypothetical protein